MENLGKVFRDFRLNGFYSFDFLPLPKENTKKLGWSDFQPSFLYGNF